MDGRPVRVRSVRERFSFHGLRLGAFRAHDVGFSRKGPCPFKTLPP